MSKRFSPARLSLSLVIALAFVPPLVLAVFVTTANSLIELTAEALWLVVTIGLIVRLVARREARADAQLRASEQRLRTALDVIDDGYWDLDLVAQSVDVSSRWRTTLGYQPGEIPSRADAWMALVYPDDAAILHQHLEQHLTGVATHFEVEHRVRRADGSWCWVLNHGTVVERSPDGTPTRVVGTVREISARRAADERLRLQAAALDHAANAVVIVDKAMRIVWVNPAFTALTQYAADEVVGQLAPRVLGVTEDNSAVDAQILETLRRGDAWRGEAVSRRKDGSSFVDEMTITPVRDEQGEVTHYIAIKQDVSARAAAEASLGASRDFLQHVVDAVPDPLFVKDEQHRWLLGNAAFWDLLGAPAEVLLGKSDYDVMPKEQADIYWSMDDLVLRTGTINENEEPITNAQGEIRQIATKKSRSIDPEGRRVIVAIIRDITERKAAEAALAAANRDLEIAAARATDLAIEASAADRAKSELLTNVSHEFRTPLNGVLGMASLLLDTDLADDQRDFAETIRSSGETLLMIVNDVLDFTRIKAGQLTIEPMPFNLEDAIREVADLLQADASVRGLTLTTSVAADLPARILGDAARIRQVLLHLVGNAIKFTHQGQITIEVDCRERTTAEVQIVMAVRDTGIGIAADKLDHLFEPFSQADTSSTRRYGGTGLGLAITRRLVELMDGEIGVESAVGHGSTFWLRLPCRIEAAARAPELVADTSSDDVTEPTVGEDTRSSAAVPAMRGPTLAVRQRRVLLADDNPISQRVAVRLLETLGLWVDTVENGLEAVDALGLVAYDLVLMDCQISELDGFAATEQIRQAESPNQQVPVVGMMGAVLEDRERCLAAGMNDCLTKPFDLASLTVVVERWLDASWPAPAAEPSDPTAA